MYGIYHDVVINEKKENVFSAISTSEGLEKWWTKKSSGFSELHAKMQLYFSEEYDWEGEIVQYSKDKLIQWKMTKSMSDWKSTTLTFELIEQHMHSSLLRFSHKNSLENNDNFRRSSYCWALYLRILKRYVENDIFIPYELRTKT